MRQNSAFFKKESVRVYMLKNMEENYTFNKKTYLVYVSSFGPDLASIPLQEIFQRTEDLQSQMVSVNVNNQERRKYIYCLACVKYMGISHTSSTT